MANYLPVSLDVENRPILIFGGGGQAYEKIEKLLAYGADLTVAAEKVTPTIKQLGKEKKISIVRSNGSNAQSLISRVKPLFVIIADADAETVAVIFKACKKTGTDVHTVDYKDFCTFTFPSVIRRKNFSVAVFASDASPDVVKWIVDRIEKSIPTAIDSMVEHFDALRQKLMERGANLKSGKFATVYREFLNTALRENRMLSAGEVSQIMTKYINEGE